MDTIFALASARGKAGVAVIRISGRNAFDALLSLTSSVEPRIASLRKLVWNGGVLDECLVLTFPGPNSFTGEDVVELHLHGSVATVAAVLNALGQQSGFRVAEPGEFTRRAMENERLDLSQVEGLADLVEAETEAQRRQALRVFSGELGERVETWRAKLIRAASLLEATIDFSDEDVPVNVYPEVIALLEGVQADLHSEILGSKAAERVRDGFEVAIVGAPNAGKSTLLNALAGREAAITSEIAGTTRDVIEVRMDIFGLPVTFLDTAGLRETEDSIEKMGIDLARRRAQMADLRVILKVDDDVPDIDWQPGDMIVVPKSDLGSGDFSAKTGDGVGELVERIGAELESRVSNAGLAIRARHRIAMESAISGLESAVDQLKNSPELPELIAEETRVSVRALESLVGYVDVEHVLGEIFSSFCIGK